MAPRVGHLLIVEDHAQLAYTLADSLRTIATSVEVCTTARAAKHALEARAPEALLLDVALPDGSAFDVLEAAHASPSMPLTLVMSGSAGPSDGFRLAQYGVRAFLQKPVSAHAVETALRHCKATPPDPLPHVRAAVGHVSIQALEEQVRDTMVQEALARANGSRSGAARLLHISRQLLQHILRG